MNGSLGDRLWTLGRRLFYRFLQLSSRMVSVVLFSFRTEGRHHLNFDGGAMLLSTHQSLLDPVLVGLVANQRLNYLARKTLFKNPAFAFLIRVLDAMLRRLQRGEWVLMFPEGTRTTDGFVQTIKPGFIPIARRSAVPIVPIAIVGAYDCLPRGTKLLTRKPISVVFGKPMLYSEYGSLDDQQLLSLLSERLVQLYDRGRELANAKPT